MTEKPRRLGRGLEALLGSAPTLTPPSATRDASAPRPDSGRLPIASIRPNPYQPRKTFKPEELAELEASLKANGLLQPVTVRPAPNGEGYELVAGERRFRAATRLGWTEIPALIKELDDKTLLTLALVENLQRADLNPMEEAEGYQQLMEDFGLTQAEVAEAVGKDRSTVANLLRLLTLPGGVQTLVRNTTLSLGHAKALLTVRDERQLIVLAKRTVEEGLSVREVERAAREQPSSRSAQGTKRDTAKPTAPAAVAGTAAELKRVADDLRRRLQTDVQVAQTAADRGEIRIVFYGADDLERVLELILGTGRSAY
jgi:ParB family transcriptional regulator, chromosome partitioning protein